MPVEKLHPTFTFTEDRLRELQAVVPEAFADGQVNWATLREALGAYLEDEGPGTEHFGLFWPGKRQARRLAAQPSKGTLRPAPGQGINEDTTRNLFIEGDNLEVLKLLQKSYAGRVKLIYIDPPYNTGNDFVYKDDFREPLEDYLKRTGQADAEGLLTTNPKAGGRFHSNWLNMMLPRLMLARTLLSEDGVIFVSINDSEQHNLKQLMSELFGEENFICNFVWVNEGNIDNQSRIKYNHEYIVMYAKDEKLYYAPPVIDPSIPKNSKLYRDSIENTIVKNGQANPVTSILLPIGFPASFEKGKIEPNKNDSFWPKLSNTLFIENYKTINQATVTSGWSSRDIFEKFILNKFNLVVDTKGQESIFFITETGAIYTRKRRLDSQSHVLTVLKSMGTVQAASSKLSEVGISFSYPKPVELLKYLVQVGTAQNNSIVLDFFSGSCPAAEAVIELNREDNGNRRFIMVQIPEPTSPNSPARQAGYQTIAEIGKERIRRVIKKLVAQPQGELIAKRDTPEDLGFAVYKLDRSHFKAWQDYDGPPDPAALDDLFSRFETPLVDGWQPRALLEEVLLQQGFPLGSRRTRRKDYPNNAVVQVECDGFSFRLFVCLDDTLRADTIAALRLDPDDKFVCLDSALTDQTKQQLADRCTLVVI